MGFEPMTQEFSALCSTTELSRQTIIILDEVGFEPTIKYYVNFQNWCFQPLSHPSSHIRVVGFEPTVFCSQSKHVSLLRYTLHN